MWLTKKKVEERHQHMYNILSFKHDYHEATKPITLLLVQCPVCTTANTHSMRGHWGEQDIAKIKQPFIFGYSNE